jgi:hypothetical protein
MSWLRIEGKMPQHAKVAPLSDSAFRLHVTAMAWAAEFHTDGQIPCDMVSGLTRAPGGKKLASIIDELARAKLWHVLDGCYQIHDFLDWNMSKADYEARARAGSAGGKAKASKTVASARISTKQNSSKRLAESESESDTESDQKKRSGPHAEVIDHYFSVFESLRGSKPIFDGHEGTAVKRLLKKLNGDTGKAKAIISNALSPACWGSDNRTILDIARDPTKWVSASLPKSNGARTPPQPNDETNRYVPPTI